MKITNFRDLYIAELQELASVEDQLADLLLEMTHVASNSALKDALTRHRDHTLLQRDRIGTILLKHHADPKAHTDQAMQALVKEAEKMMEIVTGNDLRDAAVIASAQKVEHYEIAGYGCAAALAGQLNLREDQQALHQTLEEEKTADAMLTELAKAKVNPAAVAAAAR